jgi:hypothetical protein
MVNVDDNDACTTDSCDPMTGVLHAPVTCNDDDECTADKCVPAVGCVFAPLIYFSETFVDNSKSWTLGSNWQVGPAIANPAVPPSPLSNPDPTADHTPTADNNLAGVIIGGNLTNAVQGPYFMTSPVIDMSAVSGSVTLEYWRYLNSDFPPFMNSTIDVFDGSAWIQIYGVPANDANPQPRDTLWTKFQYDISAQATGNANFRVRWGYQVLSPNARTCSSWNVDDIRILPGPPGVCP